MVDEELFDSFYNGCCNGTFWPLFHSMPDRAVFCTDTWKAYQAVNEEFARKTLDALRQVHRRIATETDGSNAVPIIWIHDYQLMLAATMIRNVATEEYLPCKLGFFLHIPFPSWDIMRLLPWDDQVLEGILSCDLVGFHIEDYCMNFIDCCQRRLGCRVDRAANNVEFANRTVHVRPLPIGIPYRRFEELAEKAPRVMKDERVILGVDRLDYTKGLVQRIKAFERLLERRPQHLGKVVLLQIAVPSRTEVKEYRALKEEIDQLVGRVNGRFSRPDWSPIRYIYGCVSQEQLAAFYRDSAVALVTPLRDGMNLVAKEYVACQINETGVLILSPFAGAGGTMLEALLVNPYDVDQTAETIHTALVMEPEERCRRMRMLRRRESGCDVDHWMACFLDEIEDVDCATVDPSGELDDIQQNHKALSGQDYDLHLSDYIDHSSKLNILLDYDGTLVPIASHPDRAVLPEGSRKVLKQLSQMPSVSVCIMSGRSLANLKEMVAIDGITYAGSQGLEILHPDGSRFTHPVPNDHPQKLQALLPALQNEVCKHGAWVENKGTLLTYHYRATPPAQREALIQRAVQIFHDHGFYPHRTQMGMEARPPVPWDKGRASVYILRTMYGVDWTERVRIVYAGDDQSDEDVMETLQGLACSFRVSPVPVDKTAANYRLTNPASVISVLRWIGERMAVRCHPLADVRVHPTAVAAAAALSDRFSVTCIHTELNQESNEPEEGALDSSDGGGSAVKRRRRNSKGTLFYQAKMGMRSDFRMAVFRGSDDSISVIGH